MSVVPWIQGPEIAHGDHVLHKFFSMDAVRGAEEEFLLQTKIIPESRHDASSEAFHTKSSEGVHDRFAKGRVKGLQHVIVIHQLSEAETSFQIMMEHMGHAEHRIEAHIRVSKRASPIEWPPSLQYSLEPGIEEGVVHLAGVKMDFQLSIWEQIDFPFLVKDIPQRVPLLSESLENFRAFSFDPEVYITAYPL